MDTKKASIDVMINKVKEWLKLSAQLKTIKTQESDLRKEIAKRILAGKIKGSKKGVIGPYTLKATSGLNQKIDKEALKAIWKDITPAERSSVRFSPSIIAAEYKKLPDNAIINQVVTETPGMPGLELKGVSGTYIKN